jgi:hypothetical protein
MKAEILQGTGGTKELDLNRRKAIKFKCLDCSGFKYNDIKNCEHNDCSLYTYRTGNGKQDPVAREKAIKSFCMDCMVDQLGEIPQCTSVNCPLYIFRGYTRAEKPEIHEKTSPKGTPRHDFPEVVVDHHQIEKHLFERTI